MAKIEILRERLGASFDGDHYEVNTNRPFEGYETGDLICKVHPFFDIPLSLEIAIRKSGKIIFRGWNWDSQYNGYLQTYETPDKFTPTPEQTDTVNGLFSGRIKFEGLEIAVGATVQDICPIDVDLEEKLTGEKIFLN